MTQPTQEQREALERLRASRGGEASFYKVYNLDEEYEEDLAIAADLALAQNPADGAEAVTGEWCEANGAEMNGDVYVWQCGHDANVEWGRNTGALFGH